MAKIPRPAVEMANALAAHLVLLGRYIDAAAAGDHVYLGEIAAKMRLLVITKPKPNKQVGLLVRLAKLLDSELEITLGGAPGWKDMQDRTAGDVVTLDEWLASFALQVETSEGPRQLTTGELVCVWAEQYGAAHEDWTIDEAFSVSLQWDAMRNELAQIADSAPPGFAEVFASLALGPSPTVSRCSAPRVRFTGSETNSSTR